jgi:glycosyltransferase involved in cell wall biosynthesis
MPQISIITVVLNGEKFLPRLISCLEQENQNLFEWICMDGLSTDASFSLAKSAQIINKTIVSEKDTGIYDAMNKGAALATGSWIIFLNSDDLLMPNAITVASNQLLSISDDFDLASFGCIILSGNRLENVHFGSTRLLRFKNTIPHPSTFYRSKLFQVNTYMANYRIIGDYELFCRLLLLERKLIKFYKDVISIHYRGGASSNSEISQMEEMQVTREYFGSLQVFANLLLKSIHKTLKSSLVVIKRLF